jgi:hypothetical protein
MAKEDYGGSIMPRSTKLISLCEKILKDAASRSGRVVKHDLVAKAIGQINKGGGPTKYGIGTAWMMMALSNILMGEFTTQMKAPLSGSLSAMMRKRLPIEYAARIQGAASWLALQKGAGALHVYTLDATPEEWSANSKLKSDIAELVRYEAVRSRDIGDLLRDRGFNSLEEMLGSEDE